MRLAVAGFHRSGTSLTAQILHEAGLFLGEEMLGAKESNPYGHFEDRQFLRMHRAVMRNQGPSWQNDEPYSYRLSAQQWRRMRQLARRRDLANADWGFKDPRVCFFLGPWKYIIPDLKVLVVYRDPGECVQSLESRQSSDFFDGDGASEDHLRFFTEPDHGLRLWDTYNRALLSFVSGHLDDCLVVPFSAIRSGEPLIEKVNARFGFSLPVVPTADVVDLEVSHRRRTPQRCFSADVARRVDETWRRFEEYAEATAPSLTTAGPAGPLTASGGA